MKKKLISVVVLSGLAAAIGCSVKGGAVDRHPPVIEPRVMTYGVTYGKMEGPTVSAMMWPQNWTEKETEQRVFTINRASMLITKYGAEIWDLGNSIDDKWDDFIEHDCIKKFGDPDIDFCSQPVKKSSLTEEPTEPTPEETYEPCKEGKISFKTIDPAAPEYKELLSCQANQDDRVDLHSKVDRYNANTEEQPDMEKNSVAMLKQIIERAAPGASIEINSKASSLVINNPRTNPGAPSVVVTIAGFNQEKDSTLLQTSGPADPNDPTRIHDVSIDGNMRTVKFTVPDLKSWDEAAKKYRTEYAFNLSRIANSSETTQKTKPTGEAVPRRDFAVFKGDVNKLVDGKVVQKGSGQIFGELKAFALE